MTLHELQQQLAQALRDSKRATSEAEQREYANVAAYFARRIDEERTRA